MAPRPRAGLALPDLLARFGMCAIKTARGRLGHFFGPFVR